MTKAASTQVEIDCSLNPENGARQSVRPRPSIFRALGRHDPPIRVQIDSVEYRRDEIFKHDSWAATATYLGPGGRIVCKFNRRQPMFGLPMAWLGRMLARRESNFLNRFDDLKSVPRKLGDVHCEGIRQRHAVAREYISGHPLHKYEEVDDDFFERLIALLREIHQRGVAYVDLHKRENILVSDDGWPFLIDFQISVALPAWWPGNSWLPRALLRLLQRSDEYHLNKHFASSRPDLCGCTLAEVRRNHPWWIRWHRRVAKPYRSIRRRLLVALRIRDGSGRAASEHFPEDALRTK